MDLPRYKEALRMTKQEIKDVLIPVREKQAKKQVELKVVELEEKILTLEAETTRLCVESPLPIDRILDNVDEIELIERRQGQLEDAIKKLFRE
jgi:hypothetical protein